MTRVVVSHFLRNGLIEPKPAAFDKIGQILDAVDNRNIGQRFLAVLTPYTLATAAGYYYGTDFGALNRVEIFAFQSLVLASKTEVVGIKAAASFFLTKDHELLAGRLHQ